MIAHFHLLFKISYRYFYSKSKKGFINWMTIISTLGIGIGTMALVIILSVFNGIEDFNKKLFKSYGADLKISLQKGYYFSLDSIPSLSKIEGINSVTEVIEGQSLLRYQEKQMVAEVMGVSDSYLNRKNLEENLMEGEFMLHFKGEPLTMVSGAIAHELSLNLGNPFVPLVFMYPENEESPLTLAPNFKEEPLRLAAVLAVDQSFGQKAIVPISFAQNLLGQENRVSSLEIHVKEEKSVPKIKTEILKILSSNFKIEDQEEQNKALFRAIKIEKLFVFFALLFIVLVATFNLFYILSIMILEKKEDISILSAIGLPLEHISKIFIGEGIIVSTIGSLLGLFLGTLICFLQQEFGLVRLGISEALLDYYPVKIRFLDLFLTFISCLCIGYFVSYFPSRKILQKEKNVKLPAVL